MPSPADGVIRLKPYVRGTSSRHHCVLRLRDEPRYVSLTLKEAATLDEMAGRELPLDTYLSWHLAGTHGLSFNEAVSLLLRLQEAQFLDLAAPEDLLERLRSLSHRGKRPLTALYHRLRDAIAPWLDVKLLRFRHADVAPGLKLVGALLVSRVATVAICIGAGFAVYHLYERLDFARALLLARLEVPERFLGELVACVSLAATVLATLRLAALRGLRAHFTPASLRLTGLFFLHLSVEDDDALTTARGAFTRYYLFALALPWVLAGLCLEAAGGRALAAEWATLSMSFAALGFLKVCPLFRSPLMRLVEGWLAAFNFLDAGNVYLRHGLFRFGGRRPHGEKNHAFEWAVLGYASLSMLWLYAVAMIFSDGFLSLVPQLWAQVIYADSIARAVSCAFLLTVLASGVVLFTSRLVMIPLRNFAAVAAIPARKARRRIAKAQGGGRDLVAFLRELPIFTHLTEEQLVQLAEHMRPLRFRKGGQIIEQNERGNEFFLLAAGEAQVVVTRADGHENIVNVLAAGDAFGEIALIERCTRTASVRASARSLVYVLAKSDFDNLFPEGSEERNRLTATLRMTKLILEAQALSHLTSRQIRDLLHEAQTVPFAPGDRIVSEGEMGESVYLLWEGRARVSHGREVIAELGPGDLIGIISVVKGIARTADVTAEGPVRCLRLSKPLFLKLCLANPVVALLVTDLSERQESELKQAAGF